MNKEMNRQEQILNLQDCSGMNVYGDFTLEGNIVMTVKEIWM